VGQYALAKHLPVAFKDAIGVAQLPGAVQALQWSEETAYGSQTTLWDAVCRVNN
jgi:hypothetical protein